MSNYFSLEEAINYGLKYAEKKGAKQAEGFGSIIKLNELSIEKGRPEVTNGFNSGCSFRVLVNNVFGFAFTRMLTEESIERTIDNAIMSTRFKQGDAENLSFPHFIESKTKPIPVDKSILNLTMDDIGNFYDELREPCEASGLNFLGADIQSASGTLVLKNSLDIDIKEEMALIGGGAFLLSMKGIIPAWGFEMDFSKNVDGIDWTKLGEKCVKEVRRVEGPKTINYNKEVPVILEPNALSGMMGGLLTVLIRMLRGDSIHRNESYFADRMADEVASTDFTLIDSSIDERSAIHVPYDLEGVPGTKLPLIEKGVLKNYLLDTYYAKKLDTESNGKCTRFVGGFEPIRQVPTIGSFTTIIEPGDATLEEMIAETSEGFSINTVMGVHMSDTASGRFSVTGSGHFIRNGKIKYPVQDVSISGNFPDLLKKIDMIGKEPKVDIDSIVPPIRVSSLAVTAQKMPLTIRLSLTALKIGTTLHLMKNPIVS